VLWKPVWNILDGRFKLLLVNPRHVKQVPGRKSDVSDAEWIAQLLQCGLLQGSFVPRRELRDLTRFRAQLASEQTRLANRIHKVLEDANVKLSAVASDILGKSGRDMLWALIRGERDPEKLAELARGRLRGKIPELKLALEGHFTEHHQKRAVLAVGHSLLVIFYHMLKNEGLEYQDLGVDYFDRLEPERLQRYPVKRLERLGFKVNLTRQDEAA
jgi:Transposase